MLNKWRELSSRKQKNIVLGSLGAIILLMAIGYAAFSSQLNINGTSNISSNWNIRITNITSSLHGGASNAEEPTYDNENGLTASFSTNLVSPGDYAEYTVTVRNNGDIDATLTDIEISDSNNPAIVFETSGLEEGDNLLKQTEDELIVKVSYSESITSQPENVASNITVTLTYEQATGGSVTPSEPITTNDLKALAVTEGDGLYADTSEEGRYFYKGTNPKNYITFNNETWRIVSVENDGTIKIMENENIEDRVWSNTSSNNWTRPADLNRYLNGEYLESLSDSDKIVAHNFSVGIVTPGNNDLQAQIVTENGITWNGKVGLITVSEYLRANTNTAQCETLNLHDSNYSTCKDTNWMHKDNMNGWWTLSPHSDNTSGYVWTVYSSGDIVKRPAYNGGGVRPSLYLSSNITLSGTGTEIEPYIIALNSGQF